MGVPPTDSQRRRRRPQSSSAQPPAIRASAFILREGRILLVRQQTAVHSYWLLPGGGVERGESLTAAVARETREECGLDIAVLDTPLALVESISPDSGKSRHVLQLVFPALVADGTEATKSDPAVREVGWFTVEEIGRLVIHPPIHDLLVAWSAHFGRSIGGPLPPFVAVGRRWVD
jgi:8-oxo-dGTP diphosphatase